MNKGFRFSFVSIAILTLGIIWESHQFTITHGSSVFVEMNEEGEEESEKERASMQELRMQYEFDQLKDPKTGKNSCKYLPRRNEAGHECACCF